MNSACVFGYIYRYFLVINTIVWVLSIWYELETNQNIQQISTCKVFFNDSYSIVMVILSIQVRHQTLVYICIHTYIYRYFISYKYYRIRKLIRIFYSLNFQSTLWAKQPSHEAHSFLLLLANFSANPRAVLNFPLATCHFCAVSDAFALSTAVDAQNA